MERASSELSAYRSAGVDPRKADEALEGLIKELRPTLGYRHHILDIGHFANILDLGSVWIADSTDGVGSKSLIAQWMGKYDTIGIDCVASNVNDVICVGAEPLTMVDYLAVHSIDESMIREIGKGLRVGAERAKVSISGGEIAVLPEVIQQHGPGVGFDLVGTCMGSLQPGTAVTGERIQPDDVIIGLPSSGIHCNGLSLARKAFEIDPDHLSNLNSRPPELSGTLGEELLTPSRIYVEPIMEMKAAGIILRGLVHITGGGLLKLPRLNTNLGYDIDYLPEAPPVFRLIQEQAKVTDEEMYEDFNMGIGFCVIVPPGEETLVLELASHHGLEAMRLGHITDGPSRVVRLLPIGLEGRKGEGFHKI